MEIVRIGKMYDKSLYKKIIATTENSLKLPQLPQQFIEHYISEYNKGNIVNKVKVEWEEGFEDINPNCSYPEQWNLKVNPDNAINIKPIKNIWSKEEVIAFGLKCVNLGMDLNNNPLPRLSEISGKEFYYKWLEENL